MKLIQRKKIKFIIFRLIITFYLHVFSIIITIIFNYNCNYWNGIDCNYNFHLKEQHERLVLICQFNIIFMNCLVTCEPLWLISTASDPIGCWCLVDFWVKKLLKLSNNNGVHTWGNICSFQHSIIASSFFFPFYFLFSSNQVDIFKFGGKI